LFEFADARVDVVAHGKRTGAAIGKLQRGGLDGSPVRKGVRFDICPSARNGKAIDTGTEVNNAPLIRMLSPSTRFLFANKIAGSPWRKARAVYNQINVL
jgi:hypothetical protein